MYICNQPATATTNGLTKQHFNSSWKDTWFEVKYKGNYLWMQIGPLITITEHL